VWGEVALLFGFVLLYTAKCGEKWHCSSFLPDVVCELLLGAFAKLRKVTINFVMSVRLSAWNSSAPIERVLMKFDISAIFENLSRLFKFS